MITSLIIEKGDLRDIDSDSLEVKFYVARDLKPEEYQKITAAIKYLDSFITVKPEEKE